LEGHEIFSFLTKEEQEAMFDKIKWVHART
jgi:hypothetical protein